jgi:hypothetical protein
LDEAEAAAAAAARQRDEAKMRGTTARDRLEATQREVESTAAALKKMERNG